MKKNLPLYILLLFLIVVNVFFLYNYLGSGEEEQQLRTHKPPAIFLVEQLGFDEAQQEEFNVFTREHHREMRSISDEIRELKDVFFNGLSEDVNTVNMDSVASLIGDLEAKKDLEVYRHLKQIRAFCTEEQKKKFGKIIQDALRRGARQHGPPPRLNGDRPPRPEFGRRQGNGAPPSHH
ncbi:hypothetical protein MHTCC0001_22550 [Flavobacteriaceae bacterium MHTCC 0001]